MPKGGRRSGAGRPSQGEKREKCRSVWIPESLIPRIESIKKRHKERWNKKTCEKSEK